MRASVILAFALSLTVAIPAGAASTDSGKAVAIVIPAAAATVTLLHDWDWQGLKQLTADTVLTVGTAFALKQFVREQRPDGSDFHSFPSDTAALAFAPASYLWDRYGWEYGVPAYLAAGYVGYERVHSKQHHWWDVAASAGIGFAYSKLITSHYRPKRFHTDIYASSDGAFVKFGYDL